MLATLEKGPGLTCTWSTKPPGYRIRQVQRNSIKMYDCCQENVVRKVAPHRPPFLLLGLSLHAKLRADDHQPQWPQRRTETQENVVHTNLLPKVRFAHNSHRGKSNRILRQWRIALGSAGRIDGSTTSALPSLLWPAMCKIWHDWSCRFKSAESGLRRQVTA
jgi:hypothetical protein